MPYQVSMMVALGRVKTFVGWDGLGQEILGWVGFWKSDPWPTLPQTSSSQSPGKYWQLNENNQERERERERENTQTQTNAM